ncbi:MAG: signal recognition particle-docking protein FtsY [Lawsonella sp.]
MNTSTIIAIIVGSIVAVTLLVITMLLIIGERKKKQKTISFEKKAELDGQKKKGSTYTAGGEFTFGEGEGTLTESARDTRRPEPQLQRVDLGSLTEETPVPPVAEEPKPKKITEPAAEPTAVTDAVEEVAPAPAPEEAPEQTPPVSETVDAPSETIEDVPSAKGRLARLKGRLARSNNVFSKGVLGILGAGDLDEDAWEEVEDTLIMADLGTTLTMRIVDRLRDEIAASDVADEEGARALLRQILIEECHPEMDRSLKALPHDDHPAIMLMVGVNGTGKTTTTGKLARVLIGDGRRVLLGAADTFRAAAADQLQTWGDRVGATTIRGKEGGDPAAVAFDAVDAGIKQGVDAVVIDTAGRLHTKTGLMDELGKLKRVVSKKASVDEVLLVIDATVGQNGILQAKEFKKVVDITGVVLTKLDGTAKGGIVFQVQEELGVPVKLVGLGEGQDDLAPFEVPAFVDALLA